MTSSPTPYLGQTILCQKHDSFLYASSYSLQAFRLNNESSQAIGKLLTIETLIRIFDKDFRCIRCQIKLMLKFDEQAFHAMSRNKLFNYPSD